MKTETDITTTNDLDLLVSKLKGEDNRFAKIGKILRATYWTLIPLYTLISIRLWLSSENTIHLAGSICFILSFLIFAIYFSKFYNDYKKVDYALPTLHMLKKAVERYKPFPLKSIWILIAILLMDAGLSFWFLQLISFLNIQVMFLGSVFIGALIGLAISFYKHKPLIDNAKNLIKAIETS